ncbi:MAG: glycosyltransferase [Candidatus Electryoneaceae bacterium]|nr:glycosyltransferase [Candidatus Electryoneaceae bacterium]
MSLTVAEVCFSRSWGGLEHYVADSAIRLAQRDWQVIPIVYPGTPLEERIRSAGLQPVTIRSRDYFSPLASYRMARLFRRHKVHSVHIHRTQDLGQTLPAADLGGVPNRILTLQMESNRRKRDIYHRWVYGRLTSVLTITKRMRRLVIENVAVNPKKVSTLYYGIDVDRLRSDVEDRDVIRRKWGVSSDAFVVGLVGRLESMKGQEILLRAGALLTDRIPELVLMFVGDETVGLSGERDRLERLAESSASELRVIFTGYQAPPGVIVPAFDVSVLATRKETFGLVLIEAQCLGIPVIGTDAGGVPEIIDDGENGLLVTPEDPATLADAIYRLYKDSRMRSEIAMAGRRTMMDRFSLETHILQLESALRGDGDKIREFS